MQKEIQAVVQDGMTKKAAIENYKVSRTTYLERICGKHSSKIGHPTGRRTLDISESLDTPSNNCHDMASIIFGFVTKQGHDIQIWKDKRLGYDFIKNFAARNNLTNIKQKFRLPVASGSGRCSDTGPW